LSIGEQELYTATLILLDATLEQVFDALLEVFLFEVLGDFDLFRGHVKIKGCHLCHRASARATYANKQSIATRLLKDS